MSYTAYSKVYETEVTVFHEYHDGNEPERRETVISAYKNILRQLLLSKAEVTQKIGEKES